MNKLGLLGPENTYHDIARKKFLPNLTPTFFKSFDDLFAALRAETINKALVAIKNSTSGFVNNNLDLIKSSGYKVIEEFELPIHLCLGSFHQNSLLSLKKIYSHPMAIKETQGFFSKYSHITFIASSSTSGAIDELRNNRDQYGAVISSKEALEGNQLHLISENIEDSADNSTTFNLIEK
ncbi:prephenate dehydratase domain-containing protein [Roseivirga sp.]|uniref:prephenate dehydratase domain-containing protein n=1 Tax=Roseivirga sp. TaxID=1964215 RepID=UPI003B8D1D69